MKILATMRIHLIVSFFIVGIIVGWYKDNYLIIYGVVILNVMYNFYLLEVNKREKDSMMQLTSYIDKSISKNFCNFNMPVVVIDEEERIIWYNETFKRLAKNSDSKDKSIVNVIRGINIDKLSKETNLSHQRLKVNSVLYDISASKIEYGTRRLRLVYFNDISELGLVDKNRNFGESILLIEVDNLNEVLEGINESDKPLVVAEVERCINAYAMKLRAMIKKYDNNKYVLSVQDQFVENEIDDKFPILDKISSINKGNKLELTLSIGVGRRGVSPYENHSFATVAKELALGRGGDQAVVKDNDDIKFFGGNTKEIEKRTRVRARVVSHALKELIYESSKVYIIGHSNPDMDCFGSAIALSSIVRQLGKDCKIILKNDTNAIYYFLDKLNQDDKYKDRIISIEDAEVELDDETLIIVVDVHNKSYVSDINIIERAKRKVIIDHHRRSPDIIEGTMLNYIEVYASSTSEMITEMIQYIMDKPDVSKLEAEGLLAGIFMDTKGFSFKTGVRTFEAASFLKKNGADTIEVKKMFMDNIEDYLVIAETIKSAQVDYEKNTAIAVCPDNVDTVTVAKAADKLLNISGILACFVLAQINGDIYISGRSVGDINVQIILESLGGGGHMNIAGAKVVNSDVNEVIELLKDSMKKYFEEGE